MDWQPYYRAKEEAIKEEAMVRKHLATARARPSPFL